MRKKKTSAQSDLSLRSALMSKGMMVRFLLFLIILEVVPLLYPNKPNGFFHPYTLGESICHLMSLRFYFCSICN